MDQDYYGVTTLHPIGLIALLVVIIAILVIRREYALLPMLVMAVFIPSAQRIVVTGLDFTLLRVTVLAGLARILLRRETIRFHVTSIDRVLILWGALAVVTYTVQQHSVSGFVNRLGYMVDTVGVYFYARSVLRGPQDILRVLRQLILIAFPVLIFFVVERFTGRNLFAVFGGVPEITVVREGRLRVQGAFAHPILAGCFWAAVLPMVLYRWWVTGVRRRTVILPSIMLIIMIALSASSTPILGAIVGVSVLPAMRYRYLMKWIPFFTVVMYVVLDIAMNAPVWHLISRIDLSGGSTGWHRYYLIDQAIRHFRDWAFFGTPSITHWGVWANDVTNQYILEAIRGGPATLVAFIAVIGVSIKTVKDVTDGYMGIGDKSTAMLAWALGAMVVVHAVNFIAVSYFGEIITLQYLGLAMIGALAQRALPRDKAKPTEVAHEAGFSFCNPLGSTHNQLSSTTKPTSS
jgi:hypothetical protein